MLLIIGQKNDEGYIPTDLVHNVLPSLSVWYSSHLYCFLDYTYLFQGNQGTKLGICRILCTFKSYFLVTKEKIND